MLRPHALQRYLPLTQNDPSHFLPPERLVSEAVQDVVRRRLSHVPRFLALVQTESEKVRQYLEWNRDYALLALYPPSEAHRIGGRIQRFGQAFPGLFNFNGKPRAHDLRPGARNAVTFVGENVIKKKSLLLTALTNELFQAEIHTDCAFRIERDASMNIAGIILRSSKQAARQFRYKIHFVYLVGFGITMSPFSFIDDFESYIVNHFVTQTELDQC
jgi:hypothetical protein